TRPSPTPHASAAASADPRLSARRGAAGGHGAGWVPRWGPRRPGAASPASRPQARRGLALRGPGASPGRAPVYSRRCACPTALAAAGGWREGTGTVSRAAAAELPGGAEGWRVFGEWRPLVPPCVNGYVPGLLRSGPAVRQAAHAPDHRP